MSYRCPTPRNDAIQRIYERGRKFGIHQNAAYIGTIFRNVGPCCREANVDARSSCGGKIPIPVLRELVAQYGRHPHTFITCHN